MEPMDSLKEDIRQLLIDKHGDVRITDHPAIVGQAKLLGIGLGDLNILVQKIYGTINFNVFSEMRSLISKVLENGGRFTKADAEHIINAVQKDLPPGKVIPFIINDIKDRGLTPRQKVPPDWNSFDNPWMTDDEWERTRLIRVEWLGETASTAHELGEISFRKTIEAKAGIQSTTELPPLVQIVTQGRGRVSAEIERIIREEADMDRRYLSVIYTLNPSLPFRFRGKMYQAPAELVSDALTNYAAFEALLNVYCNRHIHIWLKTTNAPAAEHLSGEYSLSGLLQFIYKLNPAHPFPLEGLIFGQPTDLANHVKGGVALHAALYKSLSAGHIAIWLRARKMQQETARFEHYVQQLRQSKLYDDPSLEKGIVQAFTNAVLPSVPLPSLAADPASISLLNVEVKGRIQQTLHLSLKNSGFVVAGLRLSDNVAGIALNKEWVSLDSLENRNHTQVLLQIDPMKLQKGRQYNLAIEVVTAFDSFGVPVAIRPVFPKKAFLFQTAKYGIIAAAVFGILRYSVDFILAKFGNVYLLLDRPGLLMGDSIANREVPFALLLLLLPAMALIVLLVNSVSIIKKVEKI